MSDYSDHLELLLSDPLIFAVKAAAWWSWKASPLLWFGPYIALLAVELVIGREQRATWRQVSFNFLFLGVWITVFAGMSPILAGFVSHLAALYTGPQLDLRLHLGNAFWPQVFALVAFYFVYDFFYYWWHRLQHTIPVFWVTHKLHHADQNMGVTTTMKAHPVSVLGRTVIVALPMTAFFRFDPINVFWISYSARLFQHFVHMNVHCHFGFLNVVLAFPNQHRIHHSVLLQHRDKNFASYFPIIDVIFGTYHPPERVAPPTGIDSGETYMGLGIAFMQPFADWGKMASDRFRNRGLA